MNRSLIEKINNLVNFLETNSDHLVIDADTHATDTTELKGTILKKYESTPNYYQGRPVSAEDLLAEMKMADVNMCLIWQNPATTSYGQDLDENHQALLDSNRYIYETSLKYPEKFIPAGWTDPKALGVKNAIALVNTCIKEFGFLLNKINPAQNAFSINDDKVLTVVQEIVKLGGIPTFHFGGDTPYTPPEGLAVIAETFPNTPIVAVHMGGGGAGYLKAEKTYHEARELGLKYQNIRFALSAKRDTHIESDLITYQLAGSPFNKHLFCASDAPYGRQTWNFGGYRWMFKSLINGVDHTDKRVRMNPGLFDESVMQSFMGKNFASFAIEGYKKLVALNT